MNDILSLLVDYPNENGCIDSRSLYGDPTLNDNLEMLTEIRKVASKDKWYEGKGKKISEYILNRVDGILHLLSTLNDIQPQVIYKFDGTVTLYFHRDDTGEKYWIFLKDTPAKDPDTVIIKKVKSKLFQGKLVTGRRVRKSTDTIDIIEEVDRIFGN